MTTKIQIYDTTLRDGSQGEGVHFSLHDKLMIAKKLDQCGFDYIEGGYPLSNAKDAEFFQRVHEMQLEHAKVCAFGMTRRRGMKAADDPGMKALLESKAPVMTIVGKTSDFHAVNVLGVSLEENIAMIRETVAYLKEQGREIIYDAEHCFDGWKANPEYALLTLQAAAEAGASMVVLCDTNGGTMPEEIAELTKLAVKQLPVPVGIHCHNDCDLAEANSLAGVDAGAIQVQGTINGIGERCGNADLISVVANLALKKKGYEVLRSTHDIGRLTEISRFVYETANMSIRNNQPFVGQSAFAHKGGMHVHAVAKAAESYEHIHPEKVGNERRFLVSELSGRSNIMLLADKHDIKKDKELMGEILNRVVELENQGYQFEAAEASFDLLVKKVAGTYRPWFERLRYHVNTEVGVEGKLLTEATVKMKIFDTIRHEVAEGNGPVNALDAALRKGLAEDFPALEKLKLLDYKVRVINSGDGTTARVRVIIESGDQDGDWGTIGVHENIIEASWQALVDSFEYKLYKDEDQKLRPKRKE
ncbi:Citramalate synthase [Planctomycetales bacterium 10988]|nr:Citramalate synthase [Planctomycetales bacterium 10988]